MPPPPPVLMECLVEEILLRLPPDDPATLVRAALVCKPWCRLISDAGFRRRFRDIHRTPPMLGLCYVTYDDDEDEEIARFVPTTSFKPPRGIRRYWKAVDSRHGRVLLHAANWQDGPFVIWDPITDEKQELPIPPQLPPGAFHTWWTAAMFCAAPGNCDHLDCQRGAFDVVAATTNIVEMIIYAYSWEVNAWSLASALRPEQYFLAHPCPPGALARNAIYFSCFENNTILKYDLGTREVSFIDGPPTCSDIQGRSVLMTTEDGRLGVVYMFNFKLHIWFSEVGPNSDAKWTSSRVIELAKLPLLSTLSWWPDAIVSAGGVGIIFLWWLNELFIMDLKSGQVRKVLEDRNITSYIIPFMSFYTPALGMASKEKYPMRA